MELQLEVGRSYRNRKGEVVKIVKNDNHPTFPFEDEHGDSYTKSGRFLFNLPTWLDLIEEVQPESKLKLEVGKSYRLRNGDVVKIVSKSDFPNFPFISNFENVTYDEKGKSKANKKPWKYDIVKEVIDKPKLQLEVGKFYKDRTGEIVKIVNKTEDCSTPWSFTGDNGIIYAADGAYYKDGPYDQDLVEEFIPPAKNPDGTLVSGTMITDALKQLNDDLFESEMQTPVVVIESPYSGENQEEVDKNVAYAKQALKDSLLRDESPMASHLLYTQTLNDNDETERNIGMEAGWQFYRHAAKCVVYADHGITLGMAEGIQIALEHGVPVEVRKIHD